MLFTFLPPEWLRNESNAIPLQLDCTYEEALELNNKGYNVYYYPNSPSQVPDTSKFIQGHDIDLFNFVFIDFDLKDGQYASDEEFLEALLTFPLHPTNIVHSGGGIHAYWQISDLDAMSFLKLNRRLARHFNTDLAVGKIKQLMRVPGTINTKNKDNLKPCDALYDGAETYNCEDLDKALPVLSVEDEKYCKRHYDKTYNINDSNAKIDDKIPLKFIHLVKNNKEVKEIWSGDVEDRSAADFRLGHIMFAHDLTREEAASVLVNTAKALARAPAHRVSYATNIVDKIWTYELTEDKTSLTLSHTVKQILEKHGTGIKGTRLPCWTYLDNTHHGFRLGQVIGLVAGSGVGKTAIALNMFEGFVQNNPDYEHFFIPLEQPASEIADRWKTMCGTNTKLYEKVHVMSNYDENGGYRHLSFDDIKDYLIKFQQVTGKKIGCVVIDHIGALKKKAGDGSFQGVEDICHQMKAFAIQTNTLLIMQSQTNREKAGVGDLELNKDAAYGTVFFESYCDYLMTIWQPLKRCYMENGCPTISAFKFCKIRHKKKGLDRIEEDTCYKMYFDPVTERLRDLTQNEEKAFDFFNQKCVNKRKQDRKTDIIPYKSVKTEG